MLEDLADDILFWFTQTIKPISFDYIERILRNEMYSLPMTVDATRNGITKEVAKKLIVMYEECLQNNFSSIEKLREESLS
ncbi:hypothetical protein P8452_46327 [Trifolium repens]|nr:hypothetical protein P8452_46327 [Trifolium repens]